MSPDSGSLAPHPPNGMVPKLTLSGTRDTGPYIHTCMHACIHASIHPSIQADIHTDTHRQTYLSTYLPTYLRTYVPTYLHTHAHTHVPTHIRLGSPGSYIHVNMCIYIYTVYLLFWGPVKRCPHHGHSLTSRPGANSLPGQFLHGRQQGRGDQQQFILSL